MKKYLPFAIVGAVGLVTLVSAGLLYRAKRPGMHSSLAALTENREGEHVLGPAKAAITIEEYGDFQCPPCGTLAEPLNQLIREFQPNIRLVFRNLPLPGHAHARQAAMVAEAAALQGKFWEMHDLLYREQAVWSKAANAQFLFNSYAHIIGLDAQRFALDAASKQANDKVENDERSAKALNVQTTPALFLNNAPVAPKDLAPPELRQLIIEALKKEKKS